MLEVGSGTGAILSTAPKAPGGSLIGIDLDFQRLQYSKNHHGQIAHASGNGLLLPFPPETFEHTFCHYLLLWVPDPLKVLLEMKRVTKKGGLIAVFSEPDYGGRIDFPFELEKMKQAQIESLRRQGADPFMGRKIPQLLKAIDLRSITAGILQWQGTESEIGDEFVSEWKVIHHDLDGAIAEFELQELLNLDQKARQDEVRVQYTPVFYGWGIV